MWRSFAGTGPVRVSICNTRAAVERAQRTPQTAQLEAAARRPSISSAAPSLYNRTPFSFNARLYIGPDVPGLHL